MAMTKSILPISLLVTIIAASQVNANQLDDVEGCIVNVTGTVVSELEAGITRVLSDVEVNLVYGSSVLGSGTTNSLGSFTILVTQDDPILRLPQRIVALEGKLESYILTLLSPNSQLEVNTPGGLLSSPLSLIETSSQGALSIISFAPLGFQFQRV